MQETWRDSEDKCTFIVLDKKKFLDDGESDVDSMVGDTNIFLRQDGMSRSTSAPMSMLIMPIHR